MHLSVATLSTRTELAHVQLMLIARSKEVKTCHLSIQHDLLNGRSPSLEIYALTLLTDLALAESSRDRDTDSLWSTIK